MPCFKPDEFKEEDSLTYTTSYSRLSCQTLCYLQVQLAAVTTNHSLFPSVIPRAERVKLSLFSPHRESCSEIHLFLSQFLKVCCFPIRWMVSGWQAFRIAKINLACGKLLRVCFFTINKHQSQSIVKSMLSFLGSLKKKKWGLKPKKRSAVLTKEK